jgi:tetratricopeptide (TPR) repeat protein
MTFSYPYEDLAELIEDKGFEECNNGNSDKVLNELTKLSRFFEEMEDKNEENVRDMADIYLLAGEFCQCIEKFEESIPWFKKAIIVDDAYDVPYHSP